ncbi:MAG: DUF1232 domain-containing protein [Bacteroidales bacterium]|nr:DUF1232 domain-containing protein [Bacteroidales bacterium]
MAENNNNLDLTVYEKHYSEDKFWDKVKAVAKSAGSKLIYSALVLYYAAQSDKTPKWAKTTIYGALGYLILPVDLIPDFIPMVGFGDDLSVIVAATALVAMNITDDVKKQARQKLSDWFGEDAIKEATEEK